MTEIKSPVHSGFQGRAQAFEMYGKAAAQAARTVDFQKAGQDALAGLMAVNYTAEKSPSTTFAGRPQLHAPPPRADGNKQETDGDLFTLLMAMMIELLGEVDHNKLKNRLAVLQAMASAKQSGHEKLGADYQAAVDALAAGEEAVDISHQQLEQLRDRVQHFQGLLGASESRLAELDPESPEYASELAIRDQLKGELAGHTLMFKQATDLLLKLVEVANVAAKALSIVIDRVQNAGLSDSSVKQPAEKALSSSAQALLHRMKIIELLGDAAQNKEELNQDLYLELQAKLQQHMQLEAEKYLEEVRKAEALQKTMGCIGMVVGVLVSVALIVSGVGVAAGVIGLAVMITDYAVKEATGFSIMGELMKPVMTVMQEAIKAFSSLFSNLFGEDVGNVLGIIVGIAATIAAIALAVIIGVQVLGPVISAVASRLASAISDLLPKITTETASMVAKSVTQILTLMRNFLAGGSDPVSLARFTANAEIALSLTEFGGVAVQGGLQIKSGHHQAQASEHLADVRVRMAVSEEIASYLTRVVEDYGQTMRDRTRQIEQVFADMQRSHAASIQMVRHI